MSSNGTRLHYVDPATPFDHSGWLSVSMGIFGSVSFLTLLIRAWIRLSSHGPWGHDDSAIALSFLLAVGQIAATGAAIHAGYGRHYDALGASALVTIQKGLYASQLLYIMSCFAARCSSALLVVRLTRFDSHIRAAYGVFAFNVVWVVVSCFVIALRGDLSMPWATMNGQTPMFHRWIGVEAGAVLVELMLFGLSVYLIWGLRMARLLRVLILGAFSCRLILVPVLVLRLYYLDPDRNPDLTFSTIVSSVITQASMHYCDISASMICIKPFIRAFSTGYVVNSVGGTASGVLGSRDRYRQLKNSVAEPNSPIHLERTQSSGLPTSKTRPDNKEIIELGGESDFRGDPGEFMARVDSRGDDAFEVSNLRHSREPKPNSMVIRQTRTWAVQRGNTWI